MTRSATRSRQSPGTQTRPQRCMARTHPAPPHRLGLSEPPAGRPGVQCGPGPAPAPALQPHSSTASHVPWEWLLCCQEAATSFSAATVLTALNNDPFIP